MMSEVNLAYKVVPMKSDLVRYFCPAVMSEADLVYKVVPLKSDLVRLYFILRPFDIFDAACVADHRRSSGVAGPAKGWIQRSRQVRACETHTEAPVTAHRKHRNPDTEALEAAPGKHRNPYSEGRRPHPETPETAPGSAGDHPEVLKPTPRSTGDHQKY